MSNNGDKNNEVTFRGGIYKKSQARFWRRKPCRLYIDKASRQLVELRGQKQTVIDLYRVKEIKLRQDVIELLILYMDGDHSKVRVYQAENKYTLQQVINGINYYSKVTSRQQREEWFVQDVQIIFDLQYTSINRAWRHLNKT